MTSTDTGFHEAIGMYVDAKNSRGYSSRAESTLQRLADWLEDEHGVTTVDGVEPYHVRMYVRHLKAGDLKPSTVRQYFSRIHAFLEFCVGDQVAASNPAKHRRVKDELPRGGPQTKGQFWTAEKLQRLLEHADSAVDGSVRGYRDRAIVSVLGHTGVRGAEVFRTPNDDREGRDGLQWRQVGLQDRVLEVVGKSGRREAAPLPEPTRTHLQEYRDAVDPAPDTYVFPVLDPVTKRREFKRAYLEERGVTGGDVDELLEEEGLAGEVERLLDERVVDELLDEYGVRLPSISKRGARGVMKRLCDEAGVRIEGEYLKPHGGRRGVGDRQYRRSAEDAQDVLRHSDIRTTHRHYTDRRAGELARRMSEEDVVERVRREFGEEALEELRDSLDGS